VSEALDTRAELLKLARLLGCEPSELEFLDELPSQELREFRERATDRLFDAGAAMLGRVGAAAKLVPSGVAATIAQRAFGPLLCARAAGSTDPGKAIDICRRLPPDFLADAAIEVDPRRVAAIIAQVPGELVVGVAERLGRRGEYVTMGRFLAYVPDRGIAAAIGALSDEAMLRTAFVLEHKDRLDHAVGLLPPERLPGIIACASRERLWVEALDLLDHLSDARRAPIADIFAQQEPEVIAELVATVSAEGIWEQLLPIVRLMSEDALIRLTTVPVFREPDVLGQIIVASARSDALAPLAALVGAMDDEGRRQIAAAAEIAAAKDPELIPAVIEEALSGDWWRPLAPLLGVLSPELIATGSAAIARVAPQRLIAVIQDAAAHPDGIAPLVALLAGLDPSGRDAIAAALEVAVAEHPQSAEQLIAAGRAEGWFAELTPVLDLLPATIRAAVLETS
jgi:hypothetical protein